MSFYVLKLKLQSSSIYLKLFIECLLWLLGAAYAVVKKRDLTSGGGWCVWVGGINYSNNCTVSIAMNIMGERLKEKPENRHLL